MARFLPPPTLLLMMVFCQQTRSESCSDAALCSVLNDNLCAYSEVQQLCKTKCKTCGGKDLHCPDITISHGDTMTAASPPHKVGAVANFVCDTGFKRTGVQSVTCMKGGKWSDQPPTCTAISCKRDRNKLEEGRTCQASCKRGDFCGDKLHTCQCDDWCGKSCFNATNIQCKLLSSPRNGFIKSKGRRYGQSADYSCEPGYVLIGPSSRRCRSDRKWSGSNPFCVPMGACGFTMKQEEKAHRVVHGNDAKKGDWPWQALIFDSDQHSVNQVYRKSVFGGGSLIDEGWVLSAAHVFEDEYPSNVITKTWKNTFILAFGMTAYVKRGHAIPEHVQIFEPADVFMHPKFDPKSFDYDVALVRIGRKLKRGNNEKFVTDESAPSGKVTFSQYVRPVCLPCMKGGVLTKADVWRKFDKTGCVQKEKSIFPSFAATRSPLTVTGFGLTNLAYREQAGNLQDGVLEVIDPMTCGKDIPAIKFRVAHARYTSRMFCASGGNESRRIDSCNGDSGGPAVKEVTRTRGSYRITYWMQVGIVSWGLGCAERYHGYYTSVPSVMQWVWKTLDDSKNAAWGDWSQWGVCDVTCGSGNMKRTRICAGTAECRGSPSETTPCNIQQCPGVWERWGSWASCSVSCGGGKMSRSRVCAGPGDCVGNVNDEKECITETCPAITCPRFTFPASHHYDVTSCRSNSVGSQCTIRCRAGYKFKDPTTRWNSTCELQESGLTAAWTKTVPPICEDFLVEYSRCPETQEFQQCGSACNQTCAHGEDPVSCNRVCEVRCGCPATRPYWHEGKCITYEKCPKDEDGARGTERESARDEEAKRKFYEDQMDKLVSELLSMGIRSSSTD